MKKIALAAAVASALTVGTANAYNLNQEATGLVVPNVIHNGPTDTTAVGIVSRNAGTVYWVFFDEDSNHVVDGQFAVTANDLHPFVWANASGIGMEGKRGYLVFTLDTNNDGVIDDTTKNNAIGYMSGNAFQVNTTAKDVEFVPTIPLVMNAAMNASTASAATADYVLPVTLPAMTGASIRSARLTGVDAGDRLDLRYFIDNAAGGNDTTIAFWNADELRTSSSTPLTFTAQMYNDAQQRQSINFALPKRNMNAVDVETILGRPAAFLDGFIELTLPALPATPATPATADTAPGLRAEDGSACTQHFDSNSGDTTTTTTTATKNCLGGVLAYSRVSSTAFGAVQTLMAAHN